MCRVDPDTGRRELICCGAIYLANVRSESAVADLELLGAREPSQGWSPGFKENWTSAEATSADRLLGEWNCQAAWLTWTMVA